MPLCATCGIDFNRLHKKKCGLCELRCPGLSIPELRAINNKPQCLACGNASDLFENPLCNNCIKHYRNSGKVPISMLRDAKLAALLLSDTGSNGKSMSGLRSVASTSTTALTSAFSGEASAILASAQIYMRLKAVAWHGNTSSL